MNKIFFNKSEWLDKLIGTESDLRSWRSVAFMSMTVTVVLSVTVVFLIVKLLDDIKNQKLVLVPAIQRKITVLDDSILSASFIKSVSMRVIELQEQWTYESLQDNYSELFASYYSHGLQEITKANMLSSDRYEYVKKHRMISTFKFDWKRSQFDWSQKLGRAVSIITGKRSVYINNNEPYSERDVSYLLIAMGVLPDDNSPFAVRMDRIIIDDSSEDPYANLLKQYEGAINGIMPDEK